MATTGASSSPTEASGVPRLAHATAAAVAAGALVSGADAVAALARGGVPALSAAASAALAIATAVVVGAAVAGIAYVEAASIGRIQRLRGMLRALAALALCVPLMAPLPLVVTASNVPAWAIAALAAGIACVAAAAVAAERLMAAPVAWAAASVVAAVLNQLAVSSLHLVERGAAGRTLLLAAAIASTLSSVGLAAAIAWSARSLLARPPHRLVCAAALVLGIAAAVGVRLFVSEQYAAPRRMVLVGALMLSMLAAASRVPPLMRPRTALGACALALAAVAVLPSVVPPLSPTLWALTNRLTLSREVLAATGLLERGFDHLRRDLEARPEAGDGAAAPELAARWNAGADCPVEGEGPESVLLLTVDALRYDHTGYSGLAPAGLTPNLDRLAERAVRFHRAYPQGATTSMSLPSLLWGRYPMHLRLEAAARTLGHGRGGVVRYGQMQVPSADIPHANLAELLGEAGLHTAAVPNDGFVRLLHPDVPFTRGFERVDYPRELVTGDALSDGEIDDEQATDVALSTLGDLADRPFFVWVHLFDPHLPNRERPGSSFSGYEADVHHTDQQVGRILDALQEQGLMDSTLIVMTSDHGEGLGEHGNIEHGNNLFEESVRVPLLVAAPGLAARDVREEVGLVDVAPTVLSVLGLTIPDSVEGFALSPLLRGEQMDRPPLTLRLQRLAAGSLRPSIDLVAAVDDRLKVIVDLRTHTVVAFDLEEDPGELTGALGPGAPERVRGLAAWLFGWLRDG